MGKFTAAIVCILATLQASSGFSPAGRVGTLIAPTSASNSKAFRSPFANTIDNKCSTSSSLYMSEGDAAAAQPPKQTFMEKLKSKIPPANERKKLIPLASMFFFILFNYTILRDTKDVLMITAKGSGAEVIPFIKTYVNLPAAIGFTALYSKLCDRMEQKDVFYACTIPFLIFFAAFAFIIFPNVGVLHPHAFVDKIAMALPEGFGAPLAIVRNWSYAVFYVMAEMWGSVVANPLFGLGANVALIFSGQYVRFVSAMRANLPPGVDPWGVSLKYLMGAVVASGGCLVSIFSYMQRKVMTDPACVDQEKQEARKKKKKVKMGLKDSAKFLVSSPYIRNLATLVISYGMCINLVEVSWKAKLKAAYPDPNAYSAFMGNFSSATGSVTLAMMLLGRKIFQKFGWGFAAKVTPTMIGVTGMAFYALTLFAPFFAPIAASLGTTPLMLAVLVGAAQNILSKSAKYSLFDPCKEMAYIPLDQDSKTKGKAAVDVVGNPLGKSGGALIQQFLIFGVGSLAAATPWLAGILAVLLTFWFKAVNSLSVQFDEAMAAEES
eukprot:scaffold1416_cov142-Skeletonema_menzelii.AAC.6